MATTTATETFTQETAFEPVLEPAPTLLSQFRTFLWLSSGMFSTASLAIAFLDYFAAEAVGPAAVHFAAAVVAGGLFGLATFLKLGPDEA